MTPFAYPCRIEEIDRNEFLVTFPDVPEALTSGETRDAALVAAADALVVAIDGYLEAGREVPSPRPARRDEDLIALDPAVAARVVLLREMARLRMSRVALATQLGRDEKAVRRMISGKGASLEMTLNALKVMGIRPVLAA
jgi:antitoxin HicB